MVIGFLNTIFINSVTWQKVSTLGGFYAVDPAGALLGAYDLVRRGEVHVLHAGHRQPTLRQLIRAAVLGQQGLQLVHGDLENESTEGQYAGNRPRWWDGY